jgi:cytochrome c oxidase cbb3-type subunit 3
MMEKSMSENKNNDKDKVQIFEEEKKILLDHDYDGIRELDNPLPKWWVYSFYLTIIFAVPYYVAHTFMNVESIEDEFKSDVAKITEIHKKHDLEQVVFDEMEYQKVLADPKTKKTAAKVYKRKCKACHGKFGEGGVGPNLADNFWIHGDGDLESVYKVITYGVVEKGMAAWGQSLGKDQVYAVLKYVADFKGTSPKNPKAPQGKEVK